MGSVRCRVIHKDGQEIVEEIHKVVVHRFRLSDVEDPDLYAAEPLYLWEKSDAGKFVMEHAIDKPEWHRNIDHVTYSYHYVITAELEKKKLSEYYLRFDKLIV
jgi:hypothetical protein